MQKTAGTLLEISDHEAAILSKVSGGNCDRYDLEVIAILASRIELKRTIEILALCKAHAEKVLFEVSTNRNWEQIAIDYISNNSMDRKWELFTAMDNKTMDEWLLKHYGH